MASRKKKTCHLLPYIVMLIYFQTTTAVNIDCDGKAFHCLNSTHFMICVDFGAGISKTVDEFVIQCPSTTVCQRNNRFECEYQLPTTSESTIGLGDETNIVEINEQFTTISPFRETNEMRLLLSKYLNTVSETPQADIVTDKQTQNPGTTLEIKDTSSNNMTLTTSTYLSNLTTKPETYVEKKLLRPPFITYQNPTDVGTLLKSPKDKELFQENTTLPFSEKRKKINSKTLHSLEIINGVDKLNETYNFVKLLNTVLYDKKTVSDSSAFSTIDSQNASNSSNIDIASTKLLKSFNQLTPSITTDTLNRENIFEDSTAKTMKTTSNDVNNTENFLMPQIAPTKTTLTEYVYSTIKGDLEFEDIVSKVETTTMADVYVSEMEKQNFVTERAIVSINTTESVTTPSYGENILNMTLSGANPSSNDITTLSSYNWIFGYTSTTSKSNIKSTRDDTSKVRATEGVGKLGVTSTSPYLITTANLTKGEILDKLEIQSSTLMEDVMFFTQDQITVEKNSAIDNFANIPKHNTKVELLQQTTRSSNILMNLKNNDYNATELIVEPEVTSSSPYLITKADLMIQEITEKSEAQNTTLIHDILSFTQDQVTVEKNLAIESFVNVPKKNSTFELLQQTTRSSNNLQNLEDINYNMFKNVVNVPTLDQDKEWLLSGKNINVTSTGSKLMTTIFPTTDNLKLDITNIPEETRTFENVDKSTIDKSNMNIYSYITRASVAAPYTTESEQIPNVLTIHQNSTFMGAMNSLLESKISNNIMRAQDKIPTEMSTNEMFFFIEANSSTTLSSEPTVSTVNPNIGYTNSRDNEKLEILKTDVIINDHYKTADVLRVKDIDLITLPAPTAIFTGKSFGISPNIYTNITENITSTSDNRRNDVVLSYSLTPVPKNSESLDILSDIATDRVIPNIPKLKQNELNIETISENATRDTVHFNRILNDNVTMNVYNDQNTTTESVKKSVVDSNTYLPKNSIQLNVNFHSPSNVVRLLNILSYNQSFNNTSDKILRNNFTSGNISFEEDNDLYTKHYQPELSTHHNELKISIDNKKLENIETSTNKINDVTLNYLKYYLPLTTAHKRLQEIHTTDVPIDVNNINILRGSDIFKYKPSSTSSKLDDVFIKNNVLEKPLTLSGTVQPLAGRDNIKNNIPEDLYSTGTIKVTQIYDVQPNFVSDEPPKRNTDIHENLTYSNYETSITSTVAETESFVDVLSSKIHVKPTRLSDIGSTYATKTSITKNIDKNLDISEMPYSSSVNLKNNMFNEKVKYKELEVNNTQIDYLLKELNQNVPNAPTKNNSVNGDVITDKNSWPNTYVDKITSTSITDKTLSIQMSNSNKQISNSFPVTDIPISMTVNGSQNILIPKLENTSIEKDSNGKNTDFKYKALNNDNKIERISNQITILENYNTTPISVGVREENFATISTVTGTTTNASVIKQDSFESTTPKIKENIQVAPIYPDVTTIDPQTIIGGTGNRNAKNRNYLIGTSPGFNSTLNWNNESKIHIISKSNYSHNGSATLFAKNQESKLHMDDVKINYTIYNLSNNETRIPIIRESVKQEPSRIQGSVLLQHFKYINPFPIKSSDTVADLEQRNMQVRNTGALPSRNITDNSENIFVMNAEDVLSNRNKSKEQLSEQVTAIELPYTVTGDLMGKSPRDKKEAKRYVNNTQFTCNSKFRARYADKNDCKKFYICIGKYQPILGECPVNTVFSEIKKQCTKNLSHCIINNQFRCIQEGRFSDVLKNDMYYICVKSKNAYIRFQFQCQSGYYLNKTTIRCVSDRQIQSQMSSISIDNESGKASDLSTVERKSKESKQAELRETNMCKHEGKFWDPDDCRRYYICSKNSKSTFRRITKKCDSDEVFHREKKKCVKDDSYECT